MEYTVHNILFIMVKVMFPTDITEQEANDDGLHC